MRPVKRRFRNPFKREEKHRVNSRIRIPEVRLIDSKGQMVGILSSHEALRRAEEEGMDLVEIAPHSKPPTCKIMDYGKWKFEAKKRGKQSRKSQAKIVVKEIQVRPRTGEADINIKMQKARQFLENGCKVKVSLRFTGREMAHKELGFNRLKKIEERLSDIAGIEAPVTLEKRTLFTIFNPKLKKKQ